MGALTEQNVNSPSRTGIKDPSNGLIPPQKPSAVAGGRNDDFMESATSETIGSAGSKRKRVRHRKKKTENDENRMNFPNVIAATAAAAVEAAVAAKFKRDTAPAKNPFQKPQSKSNSHVR